MQKAEVEYDEKKEIHDDSSAGFGEYPAWGL